MIAPNRHTLGSLLIWLGVLAWVPYIYLLLMERAGSIFPFLAVHLTGVLSGAWLRSRAMKEQGATPANTPGRRRRIVSRIMILLGVLVWAPYFYLSQIDGRDVGIAPFLAIHLTGVLGGAAVRASLEFDRFTRRRRSND